METVIKLINDSSAFCRRTLTGCLVSSALALSACSLPGDLSDSTSDNTDDPFNMAASVMPVDRTMMLDMASVASQVFNPVGTTLQVNRANQDPVLQHFIDLMVQQGFGVQRVSADQGAHYVSYSRDESEQTNGPQVRMSIAIGAVTIVRDYQITRSNVVAPISRVKLAGTRVPVNVNDEPSGRKEVIDASLSQAEYVASLSLDEQSPVISLITPDLVNRVASTTARGPSLQALNSNRIEVNNLFYGGESTFASILDGYQQIERQVIVFGNDSMVLGDTNKLLLDAFVDQRLRPNDVVSLVGCSNGPTVLDIGNEGLALGRAKRVTEALLARGVSRDRVLDEGCWAPVNASERFPSRGVVLELWREKA